MRLVTFSTSYSSVNWHGTERQGEPWNKQTIKGWKLRWLPIRHDSPGFTRRLILYYPSGSWRLWDISVQYLWKKAQQ